MSFKDYLDSEMLSFYRGVSKRELPSGIPAALNIESKVETLQKGTIKALPTEYRLVGSSNSNTNTNAIGP